MQLNMWISAAQSQQKQQDCCKSQSACIWQAALKARSIPVCLQGKTADTEPWYGTAYSCQPIPEEWLQQWKGTGTHDSGLHLPEANQFIPSDVLMLEVSAALTRTLPSG